MNGIDNRPSLLPAREIDGSYLQSAFLRTAARYPGLPAVLLDDGEAVTYGQLNARSDCLAHRLQQAGVMAESVVGIALRPGVEMATALLAVLKSGGAYLPLDPTAPADRSCMILQDAGAVLLLGAGSSPWCEEALPCDYLDIEMDSADSASLTGTSPVEMDLDPRNLAYVIYTSGSTGRPKGVMVPHKSIAAVFEWRRRAFPFFPEDRILQTMSYTFDASLWQFFHTWGSGAGLVFLTPEERRDPNRIVEMIGEFRITVLGVSPSVWKLLLDHRDIGKCDSLRMGFCGGEPLPEEIRQRFLDRLGVPLHNVYGPTEASMETTSWTADFQNRDEPVSIGRAIDGARTHVLGDDLEEVPEGFEGELFIGGVGVGRGYLNDPAKTAERFIPDPFGQPGSRMYRTGDRVRKLSGGCLDFCGRMDDQVKLHGHRIELGEITAAIDSIDGVRESAVFLRKNRNGEDCLVAYVSVEHGNRTDVKENDAARIRNHLRERLPSYMVPGIVLLDLLPRNVNGKVDQEAVPDAFGEANSETFEAEVGGPVEQFLRQLWSEVLGTAKFSNEETFFDVGGNSIQVALLIHKLQDRLGEFVYTVALYDAPTIEKLADYLRTNYPVAITRLFGPEAMEGQRGPAALEPVCEDDIRTFQALVRPLPSRGYTLDEPKNPPAVFILSPPRSGSTLLRIMLGVHPRLFSPPELQLLNYNTLAERKSILDTDRDRFWLEGTVRAIMEIQGCNAAEAERLMAEAEAENLTVKAFYRRLQEWLGDSIFTEKTPTYPLDPATLQRAEEDFENARYIHLVRHPCPMIASFEEAKLHVFFPSFLTGPHGFTVQKLAEVVWTVCHRNILRFLETVPEKRRHLVRFESLVRNPEHETRRLAEFLELPFHPDMANPYRAPNGQRMTDALHPLARMLGDVKFHSHGRIRPEAAERRQRRLPEERLGDPTRQLAERLGYRFTRPELRRSAALFPIRTEGSRPAFFCVHAAGGAVNCYRALARCMGDDQPFYAFRSPGLDDTGAPPARTVEAMAVVYLEELRGVQPEGPYYLGGWSLGGLIAMEMARQLQTGGHKIAALVLVDAYLLARSPLHHEAGMRDFLIDFANEYTLPMTSADFAMRRRERILRAFELAVERGAAPEGMKLAEFRRFYRRHAVVFRTNVRAGCQVSALGTDSEVLAAEGGGFRTQYARSYSELDRNCLGNGPPDHSGKSFTILQSPSVELLGSRIADYLAGACVKSS